MGGRVPESQVINFDEEILRVRVGSRQGDKLAANSVGVSLRRIRIRFPNIQQAIVVTVLDGCAKNDCAPVHAAAVAGGRDHGCCLATKSWPGDIHQIAELSIRSHGPSRIVPGAIDARERRGTCAERLCVQRRKRRPVLRVVVVAKIYSLTFIQLPVRHDVRNLRSRSSRISRILCRLIEAHQVLKHGWLSVARRVRTVVKNDRVERHRRRKDAIDKYQGRA